jgi:hypothetical protein
MVDELDGYGALADPRGDALDRAVAYVPSDEHARYVGLKEVRVAIQSPALGSLAVLHEVGTRQDEPAFVAFYNPIQPVGARERAYKDEEPRGRYRILFA